MDSLLEPEFARRTQARRSGRRYLPEALPQAISRLPSSLRPRFLAHIPNNTYDEFKHLATESSALSDSPPGFSGSAQPAPDANPQAPPQAQGQAEREKTGPAQGQAQSQAQAQAQAQAQVQLPAPALQRLALWRNQLETLVAKEGSGAGPFRNLPDRSEIRQLALGLPQVLQVHHHRQAGLIPTAAPAVSPLPSHPLSPPLPSHPPPLPPCSSPAAGPGRSRP